MKNNNGHLKLTTDSTAFLTFNQTWLSVGWLARANNHNLVPGGHADNEVKNAIGEFITCLEAMSDF